MPIEPNPDPASQVPDEPLTPMQEAIRARALATLENDARLPRPSTRRKIITGVVAVVAVVMLVVALDFGVRIMQRILTLWMEEESSVPMTPPRAGEPFFITVDPPADTPKVETPPAAESAPVDANKAAK